VPVLNKAPFPLGALFGALLTPPTVAAQLEGLTYASVTGEGSARFAPAWGLLRSG
jgi:hypothetical protein